MYARYSTCKAFKAMLCEVNDLAGQHEVIAENLQSDVIREINYLVKDIKEERKKVCPFIKLSVYRLKQYYKQLIFNINMIYVWCIVYLV